MQHHTSKNGSHGGGALDYEVTHPEWLMSGNTSNTVLNPGKAEVLQRILDVTKEIVTNYDVDGEKDLSYQSVVVIKIGNKWSLYY